jgi:hypothetical protein
MARNKAGRPGGPPGSPSGSEAPPERPVSAEESRTGAGPGEARGKAEDLRPEATGAAGQPLLERPGSGRHAAASPGAEVSTADSPASGGPRADTGPIGGAAQRSSGAAAGTPDAAAPRATPRNAGAAPKTSRSWLGALAAGLVGGAIAALALSYWALSRDGDRLAALRAQVQGVEQALAGAEGRGGDVAQLTSRLDALERGLGSAAVDEQVRGQVEALKAADAALQKRLDALEPGTAGPQVQDLATRVDQLEAAAAAGGNGGRTSEAVARQLAELETKLGDLSATVARLEQAAAGDRPELGGLTSRVGALEARLGQAEGASQEVEGLAGRVGAVTQQITAGQEQTAGLSDKVGALGSQLGALSTRMDTLADTVHQLQQQATTREDGRARAASLALTVAQLDAALDGGAPFEQALDSVRSLGAGDPAAAKAFETLQAAAASGVPTLPALRNAFDRVADDIVHAAQAPDGDGLLDQAAGNLMRLVTVRPVGADVLGESAAARVARAEAALAEGDLAAAVAEIEPLQGAAKAAAAPWLTQAHERLAAQTALAALQDRATSLLSEAE